MTPAQRKEAMPAGGQQRAALRAKVSKTTATLVMRDEFRPTGPRGRRTLRRVQNALAREIGKPVEQVFDVATPEQAVA